MKLAAAKRHGSRDLEVLKRSSVNDPRPVACVDINDSFVIVVKHLGRVTIFQVSKYPYSADE